jgi:hypothetical protein
MKPILSKAKNLFHSTLYDFWLGQIGNIPVEEIPMTYFGLNNAKLSLKYFEKYDRNDLEFAISNLCEMIFTYCSDEEICELQSDYHFYYYIPESRVFKESTLGMSNLRILNIERSGIRIAMISELSINQKELY